jgi:hypothetical protein
MRDGRKNERNEAAVSSMRGIRGSNSLSWACRLISRYGGKPMHNLGEQSFGVLCACGGVMAPDGVSVFNVTYLSGYLGMNLLNCSFL